MNAIFHRTSVRNFLDKTIESEKVEQILRAAMQAPTAGNQRPCEYYVINNKDILEQLATVSPYAGPVAKAPMAIIVCYKNTGLRFQEYAQIDSAIVSENILLEIDALGLGAVFLGIAPLEDRMEAVRKILNLPSNLDAFNIIPFGYPTKESKQQDRFESSRVHYVN